MLFYLLVVAKRVLQAIYLVPKQPVGLFFFSMCETHARTVVFFGLSHGKGRNAPAHMHARTGPIRKDMGFRAFSGLSSVAQA
jgi:hypothetical protein